MKRFTTTLAVLLLASLPMMAERVTPETAQKAAQNFFNNNGAKSAQLTDLSKAAGFPNLYIFTAEPGFVVMAADDCVQPILGYSLTGTFVTENMPDNVRGWLQGYSDEIQWGIDHQVRASSETAKLWKNLIHGNSKAGRATAGVDNLLSTTWDQDGIYYYNNGQIQLFELYNNLCPYSNYYNERTVTGCVATAMAQIMKYWNYPPNGIGSHSYEHTEYTENVVINGVNQEIYHDGMGVLSADFGATTYEWTNMPPSLSMQSTPTEINAVATLMYHCGVSVDMDYGVSSIGGSGAITANVANALQTYFNYAPTMNYRQKSSYSDNDWIALLKEELNNARPLQYSGRGSKGGHSFVCCGYDNDNKFYFNWGWSGNNDGFYALDNLVPGSGGAGGGNYNFTDDQAAIFGIRPSNNNNAPTNLTYTLEGLQGLTLNWTAATGAASYNVYRNGNFVDNVTGTTYSETVPFGSNEYYVRSVDANGELSLPTNTVSIYVGYQQPIVDDLSATLSGNDATLSWTAPDWCYPETPSATLTYGDGNINNVEGVEYRAHRYLSENLSQYANKVIYKVSFYAYATGTYTCYVYVGATETTHNGDNIFFPSTLVTSKTIEVTNPSEWIDIDLDEFVAIDGQNDIWVVMHGYPAAISTNPGNNNHGGYWGKWTSGNNEKGYVLDETVAYLIKTYLTDGTYTYNLYQDGNAIAQNISQTSYDANLNNNAANLFTVKTNYNNTETAASNAIGFAKGTASVANLEMAANDQMTITEGSQLTVSGTMSNDNAANLIIENSAQLVHNTDNVKATVKKTIEAYTADDNGWYFIASPVTESFEPGINNGLLTNNYDLYYYDEPTHYWMNHKPGNNHSGFDLAHKQGYLYANNAETTLQFEGTLAPSNSSVSISGLSHSAETLKGFNLVGNPFACNATIDKDFYEISGNSITMLAPTARQIAPCEGVMVKASDQFTVTFTKANGAKGNGKGKSLDLVVTEGGVSTGSTTAILDRARVRLGKGTNMEKFTLDSNESTQLAFWQEGQNFAVAYTDGQNELPLSFKAAKNGTYSIGIEHNSLDLDYLHLIDNMTGANIDLLQQTEYTFAAKTTDYASRFRLVFSNCEDAIGDNDDDGAFAYISNGEIIVVGDAGTASLQVVDMTGRVVVSVGGHTRCVPTTGIPAGVYVLRLIDRHNVRTQKIVIE
ncbi:MAG: thiol protease/hemagglutinin PrtT [Bacteroidales bacterium]|nr:thiol protease/hemagglutinin PrtT [Bacteroidales bacterium]